MANEYKNFEKGIAIIPKDSSSNDTKGDLEVLSSNNKLNYHNGSSSSPVVTEEHASQGENSLKNKDLEDSTTAIVDSSNTSKKIKFDAAGSASTSTTLASSQTANRVLTLPDITDTIVTKNTEDTFTNKTFDANNSNGNILKIKGNSIDDVTGTGHIIVLDENADLITPNLSSPNINQINSKTSGVSPISVPAILFDADNLEMNIEFNSNLLYNRSLVFKDLLGTETVEIGSGIITLKDSTGLQGVSINSSSTTSSYTITLPNSGPTTNDTFLMYTGSNYQWKQTKVRTIQKITTVGSSTYTAPAGTKYIKVRMVGGGGGGGAYASSSAGGGGGGGGYLEFIIDSPSGPYSYTVGSGGTPGNNGTSTIFNTNVAAFGSAGASGALQAGGAGGGYTLSVGTGFGTFGSGGNGAIYSGTFPVGGAGGSSMLGGGARSNSYSNAGVSASANTGGGGSGSATGSGSGGSGGSGIIIIEEFYSY